MHLHVSGVVAGKHVDDAVVAALGDSQRHGRERKTPGHHQRREDGAPPLPEDVAEGDAGDHGSVSGARASGVGSAVGNGKATSIS